MTTVVLYKDNEAFKAMDAAIAFNELLTAWGTGPSNAELLAAEKASLIKKIAELEEKEYKKNKTVIICGDFYNDYTKKSIYAINMAKKAKKIKALKAELATYK